MINKSRCKEKMWGELGRRRTYRCRQCGKKFKVETLEPLPARERICSFCRKLGEEVCNTVLN